MNPAVIFAKRCTGVDNSFLFAGMMRLRDEKFDGKTYCCNN